MQNFSENAEKNNTNALDYQSASNAMANTVQAVGAAGGETARDNPDTIVPVGVTGGKGSIFLEAASNSDAFASGSNGTDMHSAGGSKFVSKKKNIMLNSTGSSQFLSSKGRFDAMGTKMSYSGIKEDNKAKQKQLKGINNSLRVKGAKYHMTLDTANGEFVARCNTALRYGAGTSGYMANGIKIDPKTMPPLNELKETLNSIKKFETGQENSVGSTMASVGKGEERGFKELEKNQELKNSEFVDQMRRQNVNSPLAMKV
jgi:hypothetical protein